MCLVLYHPHLSCDQIFYTGCNLTTSDAICSIMNSNLLCFAIYCYLVKYTKTNIIYNEDGNCYYYTCVLVYHMYGHIEYKTNK